MWKPVGIKLSADSSFGIPYTAVEVDAGPANSGIFTATSYRGSNPIWEHGFLQTTDDERALEHDDGKPFFWLNDTVWFASTKATREEWHDYLTKRQSQGYSAVQLNTLPQ